MTRSTLFALMALCICAGQCIAQANTSLATRIANILDRPEYRHTSFGIEFYSLDKGHVLYAHNADKLCAAASTTKLLTEGTALNLLGPDFRFHTRVYRTGSMQAGGILNGDLVLVASGDPDLSNRVRPDDTLAFEDWDHSLSGVPSTRAVPGNPLAVIRALAKQIAAHGIKRITGRIVIDTSLFPEGEHEVGTGTVISPIVVNDNLIDIMLAPGPHPGARTTTSISPPSGYLKLVDNVVTSQPGSEPDVNEGSDLENPDGSRTVTITGTFPAGTRPILYAYPVPSPSRFAEVSLIEALREEGVSATLSRPDQKPAFSKYATSYVPQNLLAEHTSPPFSEDVKVTLKVSQNLHAAMMPLLLGALVAHAQKQIGQAGFDLEHKFLEQAGVNLDEAVQADGAGTFAFFTPEFMVRYLVFMTKNKYYAQFLRALPILGHDGTLAGILSDSPAAGHVFAKTGTTGGDDFLNRRLLVTAKGLVGYMTTKTGERLAFAVYINNAPVPKSNEEASTKLVGTTAAEIAAAAYDSQ